MKKSDQLNAVDYAQQYDETYCLVRKIDASELRSEVAYIQNSHAGPHSKTRAEFVNPLSGDIYTLEVYSPEHEIIHFQPRQGLYNIYRRGTVYLRKSGNKQFKKGFGPHLYTATSALTFAIRELVANTSIEYRQQWGKEVANYFWERQNIYDMVENPYPTLLETFELLDTTQAVSLAISANWQIAVSRDPKYPYELYHGQMPIGYFIDREHVIIAPLFKQEFSDFLRSKGIYLNVKET